MKKPGEYLRVNFGQTAFVYDIDSLVKVCLVLSQALWRYANLFFLQQEKETIQAEINRASVESLRPPLDEANLIHELIAQYLAHDGYVETARAFAQEVRAEAKALANGSETATKDLSPEEDIDAINRQRKDIKFANKMRAHTNNSYQASEQLSSRATLTKP